ncbi:MAG: VWA domain-containing protein [Polyangiaceae bacterium]|jgi:Ca-activated chloride channel family protein|nr:VWA domain-containing protein [Polyangiaceae bacterium]
MKSTQVGLFSALGMLLVGGAVFAVTPAGGFGATKEPKKTAQTAADTSDSGERAGSVDERGPANEEAGATFVVPGTVRVEGRLGHSALLASSPEETYVMLELRGEDKAGGVPSTAALSLVIDKSGSMRGTRFDNAITAAVTAVQRLREGDSVSVVAFDTRSEKVVPLTTINATSRQSVIDSIRAIRLGGDTCVSCGVEEGLADLRSASLGKTGLVQRMILLSDGATNNGIRDLPGFKSLGQRALSQGVNISTIGVDVDFDEKVLSAIATSSNGRNYFVENDADLVKVFDQEATSVADSVAASAVAEIELAPNIELVRVFDRTFSRAGSRLSVPLGTFSKGETKTVLVKVRLPKGKAGELPIATVRMSYRDLTTEKDTASTGKLTLSFVESKSKVSEMDGIVLDRLQRSETAAALRDANSLFSVGKSDEARKRLQEQQRSINDSRGKAKNAPASRAGDIDDSFNRQEKELETSLGTFATPPPAAAAGQPAAAPPRPQKVQMKRNAEQADAFGL